MAENIEVHWKDYLTHPGMSFGEFLAFTQPNKFALWGKLGYNGDVDVGTEDLWTPGGEYTFLTDNTQLVVVSSSIEDDPVKADTNAGSGIWSVRLYYLTKLGVEKSVDVTLNGQAEVALSVADVYRTQNLRLLTSGTGKKAAGNISIKLPTAVGATIYTQIATGHTRARNSVWTVPAGKRLYVEYVNMSVGGATKERCAVITTLATYDDKTDSAVTHFLPYHEQVIEDNTVPLDLSKFPTKLPAGTDIKVRARGLTADCVCTCAMRGVVETI